MRFLLVVLSVILCASSMAYAGRRRQPPVVGKAALCVSTVRHFAACCVLLVFSVFVF